MSKKNSHQFLEIFSFKSLANLYKLLLKNAANNLSMSLEKHKYKTPMQYHYPHIRMAKFKNKDTTKYWWGWKNWNFHILLVEMRNGAVTLQVKHVLAGLLKSLESLECKSKSHFYMLSRWFHLGTSSQKNQGRIRGMVFPTSHLLGREIWRSELITSGQWFNQPGPRNEAAA